MSELNFMGNWSEIKEKLKDRYPALTERDLRYEEGEEDKVINHLESKLGLTNNEVKDLIRELS